LVRDAVREVLEAIYEQDFLRCSYGFRPGRSAHDAVRSLDQIVHRGEVRWILEADIVSFFDSVDRTELKKMLEVRVADGSLLRLIGKCLHVGVLDGEECSEPERGTTPGSVLSPLLGNVYGRLFGRKGTVSLMTPCVDGNVRPHSGVSSGQARCWWSASRGQRDLCVGRRLTRSRRVGEDQKGKPVSGEDET
jgi:hypothetical protein